MHYWWMLLALTACGKDTIGEQQVEAKPITESKTTAKPVVATPKQAEPPKLTAKLVGATYQGDGRGYGCAGPLCNTAYAFDATYVAAMTVEAAAGVELLVPGQTLKNGEVWKVDLVELLARFRQEGSIGDVVVKVPAQLKQGDATLDVEVAFDLGWVADVGLNAAVKGKPFVFPTDKTSTFTSDAIVIATANDKDKTISPNAIYPEASFAEVDLIAVERDASHQASSCAYVDESGNRVNKSRRIHDKQVTVYARRTGRVVTQRTFMGETPPCRESMMSTDEMFGDIDADKILEWEKSLVKPHPDQFEPQVPPFAALGKPLPPEEGGEVPSKLLPQLVALGMRDTYPYTMENIVDSVSGSLGSDSIEITELRDPISPPPGGSIASVFKGDYAIVVSLGDKPEAQKLLDMVVAKWPDVTAMMSQRLPGHEPQKDKIDDKQIKQTAFFVGGMIVMLHKTTSAACRVKPKALLCVDLTPGEGSKRTSAGVLAKLR
jgi:hypothetical protein